MNASSTDQTSPREVGKPHADPCPRSICTLSEHGGRDVQPCRRDAGHDGVCKVAAAHQRPWWADRPNPPCAPWCQLDHPSDEFALEGGLICWTTLYAARDTRLEVAQVLAAHDNGTVTVDDPVTHVSAYGDQPITLSEVLGLSAACVSATSLMVNTVGRDLSGVAR